jgi:glycosyltransferase involved in cell wall biosynthesis
VTVPERPAAEAPPVLSTCPFTTQIGGHVPTEQVRPGSSIPRFTIVTAVYNVSRFLDAFIDSVEQQTFLADSIEVIAVDDGSTDDSPAKLRAWAERRPGLVTVVTKENGGQATARNLGLEHARGEWVTFTDPDDVIEPGYLAEVDAFLGRHPETEMVGCNLLMLDDRTGEVNDRHPLRFRFRGKGRVRNLDHHPGYFFASAPVAFFRREVIESLGLRFDPLIRPNFEDGHFTSLYLLGLDQPLVGFVPAARYRYRKRNDASSTLGASLADPQRYTTVLRLGYLDLLVRASHQRLRPVPQWLQNLILYEVSWLLGVQLRAGGSSSAALLAVAEEFHDLLAEILTYLEPAVIDGTPVARMRLLWRQMLLHSYAPEPWHQESAHLTRFDHEQRLVQVMYRYTHDAPEEVVLSDGVPVEPVFAKVRDHRLVGRVMMYERILWVRGDAPVGLRLDGRDLPLELVMPPRVTYVVEPGTVRERLDRFGPRPEPTPPRSRRAQVLEAVARLRPVRRRFRDAWVLMDRVHDADDNGQRLFEYLRAERREINAWFTVERGAPAWKPLRKAHGRRVVAHGSLRWKLLLLNASHLLSSHADLPVIAPDALVDLGIELGWRFTFLQHGVIKDDLSNWLNRKPIDTFVTSTTAEQASIVADHTGYVFTGREAVLTGLPRFDRLREIAGHLAPAERDLVLVAPTWRQWLTLKLDPGSQRRSLRTDFLDSEFVTAWLGFLGSDRLRAAADEHGVRIGFLPHPNLQAALDDVPLPDHVQRLTFDDNDVQRLFARAAVLVTDYSSMAFNTAYVERPVVYFQFDRDRVLGGEHVGSQGYFDYERDGYGPVVLDVDKAVDSVVDALARGRVPAPEYLERIEEAFPLRDGRCCERVVEAVLASARPRS